MKIEQEVKESSYIIGRNGAVNIGKLEVWGIGSDEMVYIDGISRKTGRSVNGGFHVDYNSLLQLCIQIMNYENARLELREQDTQ